MGISMTEHEIKSKIAYCYHKKFKRMNKPDDPGRDWKYAENVYKHYAAPIQPNSAKWLSDRQEYFEFQGYF